MCCAFLFHPARGQNKTAQGNALGRTWIKKKTGPENPDICLEGKGATIWATAGRPRRCCALSGLGRFVGPLNPRALPWADLWLHLRCDNRNSATSKLALRACTRALAPAFEPCPIPGRRNEILSTHATYAVWGRPNGGRGAAWKPRPGCPMTQTRCALAVSDGFGVGCVL
jgi:hypothetical protein